ncbi:Sensor histidine kinase LiaS [compost metagenome]
MGLSGQSGRLGILLTWTLLTALGFAIGFTGYPLLGRLKRRGGAARSGLSSWLLYYGVFFATGLAGGAVRSLAAWHLVPSVLTSGTVLKFALNIAAVNVFYAGILESLGAYRQRSFERHEARRQLAASLSAARAQVVFAEDQVRKELAEILHGKIQSHLMGAWTRLGHVKSILDTDKETASRSLQEAIEHLRAIRQEGMGRVHDLLSPPRLSFRDALQDVISRFQDLRAVELVVEPGALELAPTSQPLVLMTLRMLDEALLNAFRHARADRIRVRVGAEGDGDFVLRVEDDGVGFEGAASASGLGLTGLRRGFEHFGGTCEVQTRPGQGTSVILRVPGQAKAAAS